MTDQRDPKKPLNRRFSIAPMLNCTDRHARYFLRLFSKNILMYSEMVSTKAILFGDKHELLNFDATEHPIAVQLGGSDIEELKQAAKVCEQWGYDEINLNVGCPSDRVQAGFFGACLMANPELVAESVAAMKQVVDIPVTVKHRIGIDAQDSYAELQHFVECQVAAGVDALIIHARKAWLKGLSPKQNREIPPLNYQWVYDLKKQFSDTDIIINGGIKTLEECTQHLNHCDGVMLGREPYANPFMLHNIDAVLFGGSKKNITRQEILQQMLPNIEKNMAKGMRLTKVVQHFIGLFHGQANAKQWRSYLSEHANKKNSGIHTLQKALKFVA